jgi:hypothetical protein
VVWPWVLRIVLVLDSDVCLTLVPVVLLNSTKALLPGRIRLLDLYIDVTEPRFYWLKLGSSVECVGLTSFNGLALDCIRSCIIYYILYTFSNTTSIHLDIIFASSIYIYIIYSSIHLFIYTSMHRFLHIFTSIHIICAIYTLFIRIYLLYASIHLDIYTIIPTSIHPYIYTSIHLYIHTSWHLYIHKILTSIHHTRFFKIFLI